MALHRTHVSANVTHATIAHYRKNAPSSRKPPLIDPKGEECFSVCLCSAASSSWSFIPQFGDEQRKRPWGQRDLVQFNCYRWRVISGPWGLGSGEHVV